MGSDRTMTMIPTGRNSWESILRAVSENIRLDWSKDSEKFYRLYIVR
jgi:hypothetical protein